MNEKPTQIDEAELLQTDEGRDALLEMLVNSDFSGGRNLGNPAESLRQARQQLKEKEDQQNRPHGPFRLK